MATFITDTLSTIDSAVASYAQNVFISAGTPIQSVIVAAGGVSLALIAFNAILQFQPMRMSSFVSWAIRYENGVGTRNASDARKSKQFEYLVFPS